jgi:hypothetical protein
MSAGRFGGSALQSNNIITPRQTFAGALTLSALGLGLFSVYNFESWLGYAGAIAAFIGTANFLPPLNTTTTHRNRTRNLDLAKEQGILFFAVSCLAALSGIPLGFVNGLDPTLRLGFAIPLAALVAEILFSRFVFSKNAFSNSTNDTDGAAPAAHEEDPAVINREAGP